MPDISPFLKLCSRFLHSSVPGTRWFVSQMVSFVVPYTGSIGARIERLETGSIILTLRDRRKIRNHLGSIHAVALANLGEFSTGLALLTTLKDNQRAILVGLQTEYFKKARGKLMAKANFTGQAPNGEVVLVVGEIFNKDQTLVAKVTASWKVSLKKETNV